MAKILAVCISTEKGTSKFEVPEIQCKLHYGIQGDAHAGDWHRQISLLGAESVEKARQALPASSPLHESIPHGAFAENVLTEGVCLYELPIGTLLRAGEVLLQVTQIGKECHQGCAIRRLTGDCVMPREGIFAVVLEEGVIRPGDSLEVVS